MPNKTTEQMIEEALKEFDSEFHIQTVETNEFGITHIFPLDDEGRMFVPDVSDLKGFIRAKLNLIASKSAEQVENKHKLRKCQFCKRKYRTEKGWLAHQSKCFKNPNRVCTMCDGSGLIDEVMNNGYWGHKNHPCYDCETARQAQLQPKENHD